MSLNLQIFFPMMPMMYFIQWWWNLVVKTFSPAMAANNIKTISDSDGN